MSISSLTELPPCPPWCDKPAGHQWTARDCAVMGDRGRIHEHRYAPGVTLRATESNVEGLAPATIDTDMMELDPVETGSFTAAVTAAAGAVSRQAHALRHDRVYRALLAAEAFGALTLVALVVGGGAL